jgi:hypothetical protein
LRDLLFSILHLLLASHLVLLALELDLALFVQLRKNLEGLVILPIVE